jgi:hypothetical protein
LEWIVIIPVEFAYQDTKVSRKSRYSISYFVDFSITPSPDQALPDERRRSRREVYDRNRVHIVASRRFVNFPQGQSRLQCATRASSGVWMWSGIRGGGLCNTSALPIPNVKGRAGMIGGTKPRYEPLKPDANCKKRQANKRLVSRLSLPMTVLQISSAPMTADVLTKSRSPSVTLTHLIVRIRLRWYCDRIEKIIPGATPDHLNSLGSLSCTVQSPGSNSSTVRGL